MECTVPLGVSSSVLLTGSACRHAFAERLNSEVNRFVVISDENVRSALGQEVFPDSPWLSVPAGEASKSLSSVAELWSELVSLGVDRKTAIVAVGGGVVGDLAGFVASTFLRGLPFYSLPTSLLAMVDASVGGKVGIDLPEGKNLVGQFYPAKMVAVDPELLKTLPPGEWSSGMAEVIKHAILQGPDLWSVVRAFRPQDSSSQPELLDRLVSQAVEVKLRVVSEDPYETTGLRATLNLGHTFGHAIEWCSEYQMSHGAAVALGLIAGLRLSRRLGLLQKDFEQELLSLLQVWDLPTRLPAPQERWNWDRISLALGRDKKNQEGRWCFVLPLGLGRVETVFGPPESLVKQAFESLLTEGETA